MATWQDGINVKDPEKGIRGGRNHVIYVTKGKIGKEEKKKKKRKKEKKEKKNSNNNELKRKDVKKKCLTYFDCGNE